MVEHGPPDQPANPHRGLPDEVRAAVRAIWALGDLNRFEREFLDFVERANGASSEGPTEQRFEYLLVLARRAG